MPRRRDSLSSAPPPSWPSAPPATGLPGSPYPVAPPYSMPGTFTDPARTHAKSASNMLVAAAVFYALAIPVGLFIFKVIVDNAAQRSVSWGEIFDALQKTGFIGVILGGILAQVIFAILAVIGAVLMRAARPQISILMIVVGAVGVVFSFAVFGGIVGAIGGFLMIGGGAKGRAKPPSPYMPVPPPYYGPPPYRP